eukprot:TRINITY_DN3018_c0_g1_i1.p1 TRINITY_DN3018_c0_g1~~TRINITY_DN3018_c0_g1_i1.p1  ORF type:complete len:400 (+),score=106.42 TRINITY_DN3018_c0_g1_i1:46-1245(+)
MRLPRANKGGNVRLYATMEVEPDATEEDIKKSYKKMALKYHPDKNVGGDPTFEEKFKEVQHAYNILSDPQKKNIYDTYGEEGIALYENGMFGEDGELMKIIPFLESPGLLACFCCLLFIIWAVLVLIPIFIVLKVDGAVAWNWGVVFIPIWIFNFVPFVYVIFSTCSNPKSGVSTMFQYFSLLIFLILLCINLETHRWSWVVTFIPIYIFEAIHLLKKFVQARKSKFAAAETSGFKTFQFGLGYFGWAIRKVVFALLLIWFTGFLVAKIDTTVTWSWWVIAIPIWVGLAYKMFITIADGSVLVSSTTDQEEQQSRQSITRVISAITAVVMIFLMVLAILIVVILQYGSITLAKAFVPIFIIGGLLFCSHFYYWRITLLLYLLWGSLHLMLWSTSNGRRR